MYTINIEYTTGDSFNSERTESTISAVWKDKDLARKALKDIKAHYEFITSKDKWGITPRERDLIIKSTEKETWYDKEFPDYVLNILLDDGTYLKINAFWSGYFETLHVAEVVVHTDSNGNTEDKIYFN